MSEKNLVTYQELCKELSKSSSLFMYELPKLESTVLQGSIRKSDLSGTDNKLNDYPRSKKRKINFIDNSDVPLKNNQIPLTSDVKSLQKIFISSLNNSSMIDVKLYKAVDPLSVCASDSSVISDEILIQVCRKSEKLDDFVASVLGTLLVLPKMYHLSSKISPSSCDAICDYVRWHPKVAVTHTLVPFLQHCPTTQEQHRDLLIQLIEHCASSALTQLLWALSCRDRVGDVDMQVFQHLCKKVDPQDEATHTAVLTFLGKALKHHQSSVKFGQCLLFIVKLMGQHIKDEETLQSVADSHTSGMKKAIQIQLNKILKNRQ